MPKPHFIQAVKSMLRDGRTWTAEEMAARIECNEKTVRRCIEHLRDVQNWPIESSKSGFILREPSSAETRMTSPQEVAALAMAHEALRKLGSSELASRIRGELMSICRHSGDLGDIRWKDLGTAVNERTSSGEAGVNHAVFGELTLAILQHQPAEIHYRKLEEEEPFTVRVFPHRWICRDQCWYLIATDLEREGQRFYALPRISTVAILPRPKDFQEPVCDDRHEHAFGIWVSGDKDAPLMDVCVELTGYWARIASERQWHPSQRLETLAPDRVRVHFRLNELVEVKSWTLKFGGAAKVIAPDELRELVMEELDEMRRNYGPTTP
jgi:predicted DNA-binding transcriptional regulator YafY